MDEAEAAEYVHGAAEPDAAREMQRVSYNTEAGAGCRSGPGKTIRGSAN